MENMGKGLERAIDSYNKAVGSLESNVLPQARRFKDYQLGGGADSLPDLSAVETTSRHLTAPELTETDEKKDS